MHVTLKIDLYLNVIYCTQAYQTWVQENGQEKLLPGLRYNQNQLFWTSVANVSCVILRLDFI